MQVDTTASTSTAAEDRRNLAWAFALLTGTATLNKQSPTSKRRLEDQAESEATGHAKLSSP